MSLPQTLGMDARFALDLIASLGSMKAKFDARTLEGTDEEDSPVYSDWLTVDRELPDGTVSSETPCYFAPVVGDPGLIHAAGADFDIQRYSLLIPYAPEIVPVLWRLRQVRHSSGTPTYYPLDVVVPPLTLTIVKVDHTYPVLTTIYLEEVR